VVWLDVCNSQMLSVAFDTNDIIRDVKYNTHLASLMQIAMSDPTQERCDQGWVRRGTAYFLETAVIAPSKSTAFHTLTITSPVVLGNRTHLCTTSTGEPKELNLLFRLGATLHSIRSGLSSSQRLVARIHEQITCRMTDDKSRLSLIDSGRLTNINTEIRQYHLAV